jgi:ribosomal protein L29
MIKKKVNELRELSKGELEKIRSDIQAELRTIRFRTRIEPPPNPMQKKNLKIKIAVINTILKEMELKK